MKSLSPMLFAAVALSVGVPAATAADDGPFKAEIEARQAVMQVYKFNLGQLAAMAKGTVAYDAEAAARAAGNLNLAAQMNNGAMWPKGSDLTNGALTVKTAAKPEIWSTWPEIGQKGKDFREAAAGLVKVAGTDLDALKAGMGPVGKACKGCHDDFRQKQ